MRLKFWGNRKARLTVITVMAVAALAALATVLRPQPAGRRISARPTSVSVGELINEADRDFQRGKVGQAFAKYRQALEINSKSPKLKRKLIRAEERLLDEARKRLEAGDTTEALDIADEIIGNDPDNNEASEIIKEHGDQTDLPIWQPADIHDPRSTPASILPPRMAGYKITQNGWLKEPTVAGATYIPLSPSVAKNIDRIFLTVGKFDSAGGAKQLLEREYEMFPVNQREKRVNNHSAKFGLYNEGRPEVFPILASLSWTREREKWFFSVQAAPLIDRQYGTQPSEEFKLGIIMDVAEKLGY